MSDRKLYEAVRNVTSPSFQQLVFITISHVDDWNPRSITDKMMEWFSYKLLKVELFECPIASRNTVVRVAVCFGRFFQGD